MQINTTQNKNDEDPVVVLKLPYADPNRLDFATVYCNKLFYEAHAHLKWCVLPLRNDYVVCQNPVSGFQNPTYMHIAVVRFYQDRNPVMMAGTRQLSPVVQTRNKKRKRKSKYTVDHKNSANTLDNTRDNLRLATGSEQAHNRRKKRCNTDGKPCSSSYKGVSRSVRLRKDNTECVRWCVDFRFGNHKARPVFKTEREAAIEYNRLCQKFCPDYCVLNKIPDTCGEDEDNGSGADPDSPDRSPSDTSSSTQSPTVSPTVCGVQE